MTAPFGKRDRGLPGEKGHHPEPGQGGQADVSEPERSPHVRGAFPTLTHRTGQGSVSRHRSRASSGDNSYPLRHRRSKASVPSSSCNRTRNSSPSAPWRRTGTWAVSRCSTGLGRRRGCGPPAWGRRARRHARPMSPSPRGTPAGHGYGAWSPVPPAGAPRPRGRSCGTGTPPAATGCRNGATPRPVPFPAPVPCASGGTPTCGPRPTCTRLPARPR